MAQLLLRPWILKGEGPNAYLLRLAESNGLLINDLTHLGIFLHAELLTALNCLGPEQISSETQRYLGHLQTAIEEQPAIWNTQYRRICPCCLAEHSISSVGWELLFVDTCAAHGCWLVDRCDKCGEPLRWSYQSLLRCDCGASLKAQPCVIAPTAVVALSRTLGNKFMNTPIDRTDVLANLDLEQVIRLIRFLGAYGDPNSPRKPQKIRNLSAMDVSWSVTSIAAEVLNDWPRNFNRMLHNIMARHSDTGGNRFPARFGFFYATLFRRFSESPFEFLRAAFENFIAENWQGPLAKRNKRLSQAILDRASWVPANHACKSMNISRSRLTHLVATGQIEGEERLSQKGRRFLMIKRTSMECFSITLNDEVDLSTAAALLGLTTHRVRSAIAALFPDAKKTESDATPWAISRKEIDTFLSHSIVSISDAVGDGDVCFDHVLRYWTCSDAEIATLLISMRDGTIKPVARLAKNKGVSHLIFNETQVRSLIARQRIGLSQEWSVPEIANMLSVKQEVAYFLIRSGLLKSEEKVVGKRKAAFVSRAALDEFKLTYVFLRDLAKLRVTSSKALQSRLTECGIYPVTSNIAQRCRQVIYSRNRELQNVLGTLKFPNLGPDFG